MVESETTTLPDGRTLSYATCGADSRPALFFHHGTPGSRVLGRLIHEPARERGVRVVAPDRPGYDRSDPHPDGNLETWAEDCVALADELGLETFAVVGFSGGGPFALGVAERYPDRVDGAGIVASPVPESDGGPFETLARATRVLGAAFRASGWIARRRGPMAVVGQLTDEPVDDETARIVARDFVTAVGSGTEGAVRESELLAGEWSLPTPRVPVRAWHGRDDDNIPIDPVRSRLEPLPPVSLTELEADHLQTLLAVREAMTALAE